MQFKFNKDIYEATRRQLGLKDSVWVNGQEYAQIPTNPAALLFWAFGRTDTPIFGEDGELRDWKCADSDTRQKYRVIVEETAKANGYSLSGLDAIFGCNHDNGADHE